MGSDKHQMAVVDKATIMPAAIAAAPLAAPIGRQRIFSTSSQQGEDLSISFMLRAKGNGSVRCLLAVFSLMWSWLVA
jgi:hypothetical protein